MSWSGLSEITTGTLYVLSACFVSGTMVTTYIKFPLYIKYIYHSVFSIILGIRCHYPLYMDEETEAQRNTEFFLCFLQPIRGRIWFKSICSIGVKSSAINHNAIGSSQAKAHKGGITVILGEGLYQLAKGLLTASWDRLQHLRKEGAASRKFIRASRLGSKALQRERKWAKIKNRGKCFISGRRYTQQRLGDRWGTTAHWQ